MVVQSRLYIVQHGQILKQTDILERPCNPCLIDLRGLSSRYIDAVQLYASCIRLIYARKQIEDRGLSGAVRPDQAIELPFINTDLEIVNCLKSANGNA